MVPSLPGSEPALSAQILTSDVLACHRAPSDLGAACAPGSFGWPRSGRQLDNCRDVVTLHGSMPVSGLSVTVPTRVPLRVYPPFDVRCPADQAGPERRMAEDTFAGLRFVQNQMGHDADPRSSPSRPISRLALGLAASRPGHGDHCAYLGLPL
jgi:hypothetical protein